MQTKKSEKNFSSALGVALTLASGILWGFSGSCGQFLFSQKAVVSTWLVPVRLMTAGVLMVLFLFLTEGKRALAIWKEKRDAAELLMFGVFGMSACQFTYFTAIQYSNAGTATVLQYIGPAFVVLWICMRDSRKPRKIECIALVLALVGAFLLATHGSLNSLALSPKGLVWGLISAVTLAIYTLAPMRLLKTFSTIEVVGWGMLIGGILLCAIFRPWTVTVAFDMGLLGGMFGAIVCGSILAFPLYFSGVKRIGPSKGSMISAIEPVSAAVFGVLWLGNTLTVHDIIGFVCILSMVVLLAKK